MDSLFIKGYREKEFIPTINFNSETGKLNISGESYLEETQKFYNKLITWINDYIATKPQQIELNIQLNYFNTSSSKSLTDILFVLKDFEKEGGNVTVNWYFDDNADDAEDQREEIEDFMEQTELEINIKSLD